MNKYNSDLAWKYRILCSDESCIGVIGPDGCCKECGQRYEGELPPRFEEFIRKEDGNEDMPSSDTGVGVLEADNKADDDVDEPIVDDEWANRILCRDESCIGVIGPDGRCKDCGKTLED